MSLPGLLIVIVKILTTKKIFVLGVVGLLTVGVMYWKMTFKKFTIVFSILALLSTACFSYGVHMVFYKHYIKDHIFIQVKTGDTISKIGSLLSSEKAIVSRRAFIKLVEYVSNNVFKGEYYFDNNDNLISITRKLATGMCYKRTLIIPPKIPDTELLALLKQHPELENVDKLKREDLLEGLLSGYYQYCSGQDVYKLLEYVKHTTQSVLDREWSNRDRSVDKTLKDKYDALKLASIIEYEADGLKDRAIIASVFHNRLRINMKLQSDPTAEYIPRRLGKKRNKGYAFFKDKYNTYFIYGLPHTPIGTVSKNAIHNTLNPANTKYLYFVSYDGFIDTVYAETYNQHLRNVYSFSTRRFFRVRYGDYLLDLDQYLHQRM